MNTSYDPFHLVNSYGAFGSVGKRRFECIIMGTNDLDSTNGMRMNLRLNRVIYFAHTPIIAPYQPRLDWQIWFAAMGSYKQNPWLVHLVYKLLQNDSDVLRLIKHNPFGDESQSTLRLICMNINFLLNLSREPIGNVNLFNPICRHWRLIIRP